MLAVRTIAIAATLLALASPAAAMYPNDPASVARPLATPQLFGYELPVAEPLLLEPDLMPGAPRAYRAGVHEGIDFRAPYGMPVRAARDGIVVRIDRQYVEWSAEELAAALAAAVRAQATPPDVLDRIRGRQVWIDHGDGVVTRYAHLSKVAALGVGERVTAGEVVGNVGALGYPQGGPHLHFEIRVGDGYLGEGLSGEEVGYALARAFSASSGLALRAR